MSDPFAGMAVEEDAFAGMSEEEQLPKGSALDAIIEPIQTIGAGLAGEVEGGLSGILTTQGLDKAVSDVEQSQQKWARRGTPETQAGEAALQNVGDVVNWLTEKGRIPMSGVGGIVDLLFSFDPDKAANTVREIQEKGFGEVFGDRAFEATGSPLLATMAYMSPDTVLDLVGGKILNRSIEAAQSGAGTLRQSLLQKKIARDFVANPEAAETAGTALIDPRTGERVLVQQQTGLQAIGADDVIEGEVVGGGINPRSKISADEAMTRIQEGSAKIMRDPLAKDAIGAGWDPAITASITNASPTDHAKMSAMIDRFEEGRSVAVKGIMNRPSDIAGDSFMERYKFIKGINQQAGRDVDAAAKALRGVPVDIRQPLTNFVSDLSQMGVEMGLNRNTGKIDVDFDGSDIEFSPAATKVLNNLVERMNKGDPIDAYQTHRFKKLIDEMSVYGKTESGYSGNVDRLVKRLRSGLNNSMRDVSPEYARANDVYSETIEAIGNMKTATKADLDLSSADARVGQELRKMMSNYRSRADIYDSVVEMDNLSAKYGAEFDDSVIAQTLFVDEMARLLGTPSERRAFETLMSRATKKGVDAATTGGSSIMYDTLLGSYDWMTGQSPEKALKTMRAFLDQSQAAQ